MGFVRTSEPLPVLPEGMGYSNMKYSNPRISFDGKYWYLAVAYEEPCIPVPLTGESIGIDLGVKKLAVCSDGSVYENINRSGIYAAVYAEGLRICCANFKDL